MMHIEVNRLRYDGIIKQITVNASVLECARRFAFTLAATDLTDFKLKVGNSIRVYVDDQLRLDGSIEKVERRQSMKTDNVVIAGRSKTGDLIDSTIDERVQFNGGQSLRTVAETLIEYLEGFDRGDVTLPGGVAPVLEPFIKVVIDEDIEDFRDDENLNEEPGQTYFDIIEKFARKRSVLVTTNGEGDLVFTRGRGNAATSFRIANLESDRSGNFIKQMRVAYDSSKRFSEYKTVSQPSLGNFDKLSEITPENLILSDGQVLDPNIRSTRRRFIIAENASSSLDCGKRARWEAIKNQSESVIYRVQLAGHSQNGNVWDSNISVDVRDDHADIKSRLLVRDVIFRESVKGGATTSLVCVPPDSYAFAKKPVQEELGELYSDLPLGVF